MRANLVGYVSLCFRTARNIYLVAGKTRHGRLIERDFLGRIALLTRIPHDQPLADPCQEILKRVARRAGTSVSWLSRVRTRRAISQAMSATMPTRKFSCSGLVT